MRQEISITNKYIGAITDYSHSNREDYLILKSNYHKIFDKQLIDSFFLNLMQSREVALKDQFNFSQSNITTVKGEVLKTPCIYVTIHMGSFRIIPHYLISKGIKICLPITKRVYQEQAEQYKAIEKSTYHTDNTVEIVNVEEPGAIMKLIRLVKGGYSLLIYLDGNSGIGGMERQDNKLIEVLFFEQIIYSRKGIGFLSYILKLPVQPIITYYHPSYESSTIKVALPSNIDFKIERENYIQTITNNLWKIFEKMIKTYPDQWEGWLYIDSFLRPVTTTNHTVDRIKYCFNSLKYDFINNTQGSFLYDLEIRQLVKLTHSLFGVLSKINTDNIAFTYQELEDIFQNKSLIKDMIEKKIFIK
jgi:lauroyl/myristoyl acyltransferase